MVELTEEQVEARTDLFANFIENCDSAGVDITSNQFRLISEFATRDGIINIINQKVTNLADLKLEDLSDREVTLILKRARLGLKRIIEQRSRFHRKTADNGTVTVFGPYFYNRKMRRHLLSKVARRTKPSLRASEIVRQAKAKKATVSVAPPIAL